MKEAHLGVGAKGHAAGERIRGPGRGGVGLWVRGVAPGTSDPPKESGAVGKAPGCVLEIRKIRRGYRNVIAKKGKRRGAAESRAFAGCKGQEQALMGPPGRHLRRSAAPSRWRRGRGRLCSRTRQRPGGPGGSRRPRRRPQPQHLGPAGLLQRPPRPNWSWAPKCPSPRPGSQPRGRRPRCSADTG